MSITSYTQARAELRHLANEDLYGTKEALKHADLLIRLIDRFPDLQKDEESSSTLCQITEGLYSIKEHLPQEKQERIVQLFRISHHIKPTHIRELMQNHEPAENLVNRYQDIEAIIRGKQEHPVPMNLLVGEKMPCKTYFKSIIVELGDGSTVKVCQGLLAHFSEMFQVMLQNTAMKTPEKLVLEQLNRHQFDTLVAFLETSQKSLINPENALPLLYAAVYLQIPELIEICSLYLYLFLDDDIAANLLNMVPKNLKRGVLVFELEKYLSKIIKEGLLSKMPPSDFQERLNLFRERLDHPVKLNLSGTDITDEKLNELIDMPIQELDLTSCQKLTKNALPILAKLKSLNKVILDGNEWVNDDVLKEIPTNIKSLSIGACKNFTNRGLDDLEKTAVRELSMFGCQQLRDEDFVSLPTSLNALDISYCSNVNEKAFNRVGKMDSLRTLVLTETPITNAQAFLLPKHVEKLDLSGCQLDDEAMDAFVEMNRLQELHLNSLKITDEGLKKLPSAIKLLSLNGCKNITDDGVSWLTARRYLNTVFLRRCPKVTKSAVEKFGSAVDVGWDEDQPSRQARRWK